MSAQMGPNYLLLMVQRLEKHRLPDRRTTTHSSESFIDTPLLHIMVFSNVLMGNGDASGYPFTIDII